MKFTAAGPIYVLSIDLGSACRSALPSFGPIQLQCDPRGISFAAGLVSIGAVKWFNSMKGYGFIQPEDGSKDVFVHVSAVERAGFGNLREGQRLSSDVERR